MIIYAWHSDDCPFPKHKWLAILTVATPQAGKKGTPPLFDPLPMVFYSDSKESAVKAAQVWWDDERGKEDRARAAQQKASETARTKAKT